MSKCPFCESSDLIILEESKSSKVFFSNPRLVKGHLLVIPKRHIEQTWELSEDETQDICRLIKKYQKKITETLAAGCDIRQNYRPFLEQNNLKINHLHFHLIPREMKDDIYVKTRDEQELFNKLEEDEIIEIMGLLKVK